MHVLHARMEEDPLLREALAMLRDRTYGNPLKFGIGIDFNPFWLVAQRASQAGLPEEAVYYAYRFGFYPFLEGGGEGLLDLDSSFGIAEAFMSDIFPKARKSPYLLRILSRPARTHQETDARAALAAVARESSIPTMVDTRDPPRLVAKPGSAISGISGQQGTLGGYLRDRNSAEVFAATCGHVLSVGPTQAGLAGFYCQHSVAPQPLTGGTPCNPQCPEACANEIALVAVPPSMAANSARSVANIITPGDNVVMSGATSKTVPYEMGYAVVDVAIGGYCFSKMMQFSARVSRGILPVSWSVAVTAPPEPGDSGAWLIRGFDEWAGMVVAADHLHGYALAATSIVSETNNAFGMDLELA